MKGHLLGRFSFGLLLTHSFDFGRRFAPQRPPQHHHPPRLGPSSQLQHVLSPLSFEVVIRYEPGAAGKGKPIVAKILEWMPAYAAAHLTGIRTPDGRETEGWFVAAPLLQEQMLAFPRADVYARILAAIDVGVSLGAKVAGLGAFTGVVGDGGVTIAERSPIPVTTGNSLTIAAAVRGLF